MNNLPLEDPAVAFNGNDLVRETTSSNYNEDMMPYTGDCSIQKIIKEKDDCIGIPESFTKVNEHIAEYRQQKRQKFYLFQKTARTKIFDENFTINELSPKKIRKTCQLVPEL